MAYHTHRIWLLLLLSGANALIFEQEIYKVEKPTSDYYLVAPELLRHQSFVIATANKTDDPPSVLELNVATIGSNKKHRGCTFTLEGNENAEHVDLRTLRRLQGPSVLLESSEQMKNGERTVTLAILDLEICKITFPLPQKVSDTKGICLTGYNKELNLFTGDSAICKNIGEKCRINYRGTIKVEALKTDLLWSSLRIEPTLTYNVFIMHGLNGNGMYQVELYNYNNNIGEYHRRTQLLLLPNVERMQIITSDFAVCYTLEENEEDTTIYCSQFDKWGELIFNSTVTYPKRVTLIIFLNSDRSGKIVLIVGNQKQIDRSEVLITTLKRDDLLRSAETHIINLPCSTVTQIMFGAHYGEKVIEIEYLFLDNNNKFHYNMISVID